MKKISLLFSTCIPFIILSCTSIMMTTTTGYQNTQIIDRSLAIYVAPNTSISISNEIVNKHLGDGDSLQVYNNFVQLYLPESIKKTTQLKGITHIEPIYNNNLQNNEFITSKKDTFSIMLPPAGTKIQLNNNYPDIILFIDNLTCKLIQKYSYSQNGGYFSPAVDQSANCVFWDNEVGKVISYGQVRADSENFFPRITKGLWEKSMDRFAENLVKSGPFYVFNN